MSSFSSSRFLLRGALLELASVLPLSAQQKVSTTSASVSTGIPQFFWFQSENALRIGTVSGSAWANIGDYSFAFGADTEATAMDTFAFGSGASARGVPGYPYIPSGAIAFGPSASAGYGSIAMGQYASASGEGVAIGPGTYAENGGVNLGGYGYASGGVALGSSFAFGGGSLSAITNALAHGDFSTAIGAESFAGGDYSVAIGARSEAHAWGTVVFGVGNKGSRKNGTAVDPDVPSAGDPIFEFARSDPARGDPWSSSVTPAQNALTIYRDGDVHAIGAIRVPQRGDIPMGTYTAKPSGVSYP